MKNFACLNLNCKELTSAALADCEEKHCPFAWQRRSVEDRAEMERKDALQAGQIITVDNGGPNEI